MVLVKYSYLKMRILKTDGSAPNENIIGEAINVLAHGGVVLYPTDTVYGLVCLPSSSLCLFRYFPITESSLQGNGILLFS